jgi:hypothetical protein
MRAETASLADIRSATGFAFTDWVCVGNTNEKGELSLKSNITVFNVKGLYMHAFEHDGILYPFYAGKSAAKEQAVNHRIRCEYHEAQNTGMRANGEKRHPQGPYAVNRALEALGIRGKFYVSVLCLKEDNTETIDGKERTLLSKFDFIGNRAFNKERRLEDIAALVKPAEPASAAPVPAAPASAAPAPAEPAHATVAPEAKVACADPIIDADSIFKALDTHYSTITTKIGYLKITLNSYMSLGVVIESMESAKAAMTAELEDLVMKQDLINAQRLQLKALLG